MLDGEISICRRMSNEGSCIIIQIVDNKSRSTIIDVEIDPKSFGNAVTGLSSMPIKFSVRNTNLVGKTREVKKETITLGKNATILDLVCRVSALEVDGWKERSGCLETGGASSLWESRSHTMNGDVHVFTVEFIRYVQ